jgi:excinuclease ABC subunit A
MKNSSHSVANTSIRIRGARTHNLKNIDLDIPRHCLVVITGLSGSGKSSLAFDTLYAEGQRRYVESLSAYARQFLKLMDKPEVDLVEGLSPAISIEQKATSHNPRSTVGTITELNDYLRLLFARVGSPYCPHHHLALRSQAVSQMVDTILALPTDTRVLILAPISRNKKGEFHQTISHLQTQGFVRFRIDKSIYAHDNLPSLKKNEKHDIDVIVDRLKVSSDKRQRLAESFETALHLGDKEYNGRAIAFLPETQEEYTFNTHFACPETTCHYTLDELEPRLFSFNSPLGACPDCSGLGVVEAFDPERVVVFPGLSLSGGAIKGWDKRNHYYFSLLECVAKHYDFSLDTPFKNLTKAQQKIVLYGSGTETIPFNYTLNSGQYTGQTLRKKHVFEGIIPNMERRYRETNSSIAREELTHYLSYTRCCSCQGTRLRTEAQHVSIGQNKEAQNLPQIHQQTLEKLQEYFKNLELTGSRGEIATQIVYEIQNRLRFLNDVGLGYLSLARSADTLSGGEAQRIRLASQIGSGLTGIMYILDEPSIGLHQRDNDRLIATLKHLRDLGNTVIVVEHDEDMIRTADWVIDLGPGAGVHGGQLIVAGPPKAMAIHKDSLTGHYLSGKLSIPIPKQRKTPQDGKLLQIKGASRNNLKSIDVSFPVGVMTCVTGVSGSGKSTLVNHVLYPPFSHPRFSIEPFEKYDYVEGTQYFDKAIRVDQSPIGRTPRSNPATYTGLFTEVRNLMAETPIARERGYHAGRFSFNVRGGRCNACQGGGVRKIEMHFLSDVYVSCDVCQGKRYNRETLEVQYKGKNIADILDMTVEVAAQFFAPIPNIAHKLKTLTDVGLGYLTLGQSATTLSGGEAQRVKLALELSKRATGQTLYILDEPTTGLHFADIALLLEVLQRLRDAGNTIVIIEHNLDVIKTADWIIDLGPEGGEGGGQVVAVGTPEDVVKVKGSYTGKYLKRVLSLS